jgi:hypothetical protein
MRPAESAVGRPQAADAAGRAGTRDDDELCAVERREHRRERVPGVFADEHCRPAPAGVERLHGAAGLDEALLVEDAVGRQEDFAVDVPDAGVRAAERGVERGVVQPVLEDLVEADRDVERWSARRAVLPAEVVEQPLGGDGEVPHAAFDEIAGERCLRREEQFRRLRPARHLAEERAEPAEILVVRPLPGPELGDRDRQGHG